MMMPSDETSSVPNASPAMSRRKTKPPTATPPGRRCSETPDPTGEPGASPPSHTHESMESFADYAARSSNITPLDPVAQLPPRRDDPTRFAATGKRHTNRPARATGDARSRRTQPRDATAKERRRIRSGALEPAVRIDLHGLDRSKARGRLEHGLVRARALGVECVLVIHGKGVRSRSGHSVLKPALFEWISEPPLDVIVRAVAPAEPHDGGSGATYLLLAR